MHIFGFGIEVMNQKYKLGKLIVPLILLVFSNAKAQDIKPVRLKTADVQITKGSVIGKDPVNRGIYLLQFKDVPTALQRQNLAIKGVKLHDFVPDLTWYATVSAHTADMNLADEGVVGISLLKPEWKADNALLNGQFPDWSLVGDSADFIVFLFENSAFSELDNYCRQNGMRILENQPRFLNARVRVKRSRFNELLNFSDIYWVEPVSPPVEGNNLPGRINHRALALNMPRPGGRNLWGKGVVVGEWDGAGIGSHVDYNDRLINKNKFVAGAGGNHATHVAGTITGGGIIDPFSQGMAPKATIFGWDFGGNIPAEMDTACFRDSIVMTNNSYGYSSDPCATRGTYDGISRNLDILVNMYPYLSHQFSSGNSRTNNCAPGGYRTINSGFQAAKNNLTIGALQWDDGNSSFHSYGPMRDGRMKPEICANGVNVYSTLPNNTYQGGWNGTSMSCPGATGTIALLHERFTQLNSGVKPLAHTIKAIVCNTADDIGNVGPDYAFGFGRINGLSAIDVIEKNLYTVDSVTHGNLWTDTITVAAGLSRLQVFLAWDDVPASAGASPSLVNDLDLEVVDNLGTVHRPWTLNPACHTCLPVRKRDSLNNAEQFYMDNPTSGTWVIRVRGRLVTTSNEIFTVCARQMAAQVRVTYPNGSENMLPPTTTNPQTISWDAFGTTSTFTLEYSADSGTTWTNIATGISNATRFFTWNNAPAGLNTRRALVRVRSGALADVSDTTFNIYWKANQPDAVVCDRQIHLYWSRTPGAARYRVLQGINSFMEEIGTTTDTFFTVFNLVNGQAYWFALQAIGPNNETGPRTNGKSFIPQNTPTPPTISVNPQSQIICQGTTLKLNSVATGTNPFSRQWQFSADSGKTWQNIAGETLDSVAVSNYPWAKRGYRFRNRYQNICRNLVWTQPAIINVDTPMVFSSQLADPWKCEGDSVEWNLTVASATIPKLQWQKSTDHGANWTDLGADTTGRLKITNLKFIDNKNRYRLLATNYCETNKASDEGIITVAPPLQLKVPVDTVICYGNEVALKAIGTGGDSTKYQFQWSGFAKGDFIKVKPLSKVVYRISLDDQCSYNDVADSVIVDVRPALSLSISKDTTLCQGRSTTIQAALSGGLSSGYVYNWMPGNVGTASFSVSPTKTTTYTLKALDGCTPDTITRTVVITMLDSLKISLNKDTQICFGNQVQLNAAVSGGLSGSRTVNWNSGLGSGMTKLVIPSASSLYMAVVSDGCSVLNDTAEVNVNVLPALQLTLNPDTTICKGRSVQLSASATGGLGSGRIISWNNSLGIGASHSVTPTVTNTWRAVLSDGCSAFNDTQFVTVNVRPELNISIGNDTVLCNGNPVQLLASTSGGNGLYSVLWQNVANPGTPLGFGSSLNITPASSMSIRAIISDGCTVKNDSAGKVLTVLPALSMKTSPDTSVCELTNARLRARTTGGKGIYQYQWSIPASSTLMGNDSNLNISISASTIYRVIVSDGCSAASPSFDIRVTVVPMPVADFSLVDAVVCEPELLDIRNSSSGLRFRLNGRNYSGADTSLSYAPGAYSVQMIALNSLGCADTASQPATVHPKPVAGFTLSPSAPREKDIVKITDASTGASVWNWNLPNGGFNTQAVPDWTANDTGIFILRQLVQNSFGCEDTISRIVRVGIGYYLHIPTAFTPDENGLNDYWKPEVRGVVNYKLQIFNRWGEQVFSTDKPEQGWNAVNAPTGVYGFSVSFISAYGEKVAEKGTLNLIR